MNDGYLLGAIGMPAYSMEEETIDGSLNPIYDQFVSISVSRKMLSRFNWKKNLRGPGKMYE